ncbi:MAG: aminotransferase class IV family protein [Paracoccaceae bacterium]
MESPLCPPGTRLIETMLWDGAAFPRLSLHMARLARSARALGFLHDPRAVQAALTAVAPPGAPARIRLTLGQPGDTEATAAPLPPAVPVWRLSLAPDRLSSADPFLAHKTTRRALYDRTRAALPAGADEAIFLNERGEVCEGTIANVFFDDGHGLMTPPLSCGCLPGVLRAELIASGRCREAVLTETALPRVRLCAGNALRGLIPARLA